MGSAGFQPKIAPAALRTKPVGYGNPLEQSGFSHAVFPDQEGHRLMKRQTIQPRNRRNGKRISPLVRRLIGRQLHLPDIWTDLHLSSPLYIGLSARRQTNRDNRLAIVPVLVCLYGYSSGGLSATAGSIFRLFRYWI